MAKRKIFISCTSGQFRKCRDELRSDLNACGADVVVQEDFRQYTDGTLLEKLQHEVDSCTDVIALVGDAYGAERSVNALPTGMPRRSYTQWEYHFARGERLDGSRAPGKSLYVYFAGDEYLQQNPIDQAADVQQLQRDFRQSIRDSNRDRNTFRSLDHLCRLVLRDGFGLPESRRGPRNLPYRSIRELFKGREGILGDLAKKLLHPSKDGVSAAAVVNAVYGLGGVGKTRTAVEFALRHETEFSALLFVVADTRDGFERNLADLSAPTVLNLPEHTAREQDLRLAAVLRWLDENSDWLLLLDNVDTAEAADAAQERLANLRAGSVLITSRLSDWPADMEALPLDVLDPTDAKQFLLERTANGRRRTDDDDSTAAVIVDDLGCLALALEQVGAFIVQRKLTFAQYRTEWAKSDRAIRWFDERLMNYPRSVATTWETSFQQLGDEAKRMLEMLAWFSPEPIPESILDVEPPAGPFEHAHGALAELAAFSLASRSSAEPVLKVHRLVQQVARLRQADDNEHKSLVAALGWVDDAFVGEPNDVRSWRTLDPLVPHAESVAYAVDEESVVQPTTRLLNRIGLLHLAKARFSPSEIAVRKALAIDEKSLGSDHPDVAISLNNLAQVLQATNRLAEAEPLMRRALSIDETSFGSEHPNIARNLNNLAWLLKETNRLAEAEPLMRRALAIDEKSFGSEHFEVAINLNNLALLLQATNRLAEAEPLMRRALEIYEMSFGSEHPNVARGLNNLALLLQATNRLAEAEPMMRRALKIDEMSFGSEHPDVARGLNNLAQLLQATNRLAEAEPLMRRALEIDEMSFGSEHPDVARDLNNLGRLLHDTNQPDEAEPLMRKSLSIHAKFGSLHGHTHPNFETVKQNYVGLLKAMEMNESEVQSRVESAIAEGESSASKD